MSYYEIIYEDGTHSVAEFADDKEAISAAGAHHERAVNGEKGGPGGHPAVRVKRILKYAEHPADYGENKLVYTAEVSKLIGDSDLVNVDELTSQVRDLSSAIIPDSKPHDTNYKMREDTELVLPWA